MRITEFKLQLCLFFKKLQKHFYVNFLSVNALLICIILDILQHLLISCFTYADSNLFAIHVKQVILQQKDLIFMKTLMCNLEIQLNHE